MTQPTSKLESMAAQVVAAMQRALEQGVATEQEALALNYLLTVLDNRGGHHQEDAAPAPMGDVVLLSETPMVQVHVQTPDQITTVTRPNINMTRLSYGFVNLDQVTQLDVLARQLYLVGGVVRSLDTADTKTMVWHLRLYLTQ